LASGGRSPASLERAQARGELRERVDHRIVLEVLTGLLSLRVFLTREPVDENLLHAAIDMVLAGISAAPKTVVA
jgi:tetracycline repressor-like protein